MARLIFEWVWRAVIVCALGWIGWELHQIHQTLLEPADESNTAAVDQGLQERIDDIANDVATLNEKVDAIMVAMLRLAR